MSESQNADKIKDCAKNIRIILNIMLKISENAEPVPPYVNAIIAYLNEEFLKLEKLL